MDHLTERNNTNFPKELREAIKKIKLEENDPLALHQRITVEYVTKSPARGLLVLHEMGTGKSITGVAISEGLLELGYNILFISTKSLHSNFRQSVQKYYNYIGKTMPENHLERINYITYNAGNMMAQIKKVTESLENYVIIFDEAHNFFNSITNGSEKAIALYTLLMNTTNCKIIFLTGTAMINDPYEIALCFNMLSKKEGNYELFGDDYELFTKYFVSDPQSADIGGNPELLVRIKNREKFKQRIAGLASVYHRNEDINKFFPKKFPLKIEKIPMSDKQYVLYALARDSEMEEAMREQNKPQKVRYAKPSGGSSSYRIKSRQISNGIYPDSEVIRKEGKVTYVKGTPPSLWTKELLQMYSPKILQILENVSDHLPDDMLKTFKTKNHNIYLENKEIGTGIIYSTFLDSGVEYLARVLQDFGMRRIDKFEDILNKDGIKGGTFVVQSGEMDPEERALLLKTFNSKENITGNIITLYLYTATGAEGMDTANVRHSHIFESYWNWNRIAQVEARAVRYRSADDLPEDQRTVRTYIYLSIVPSFKDIGTVPNKVLKIDSTDLTLFQKSLQNKKLLDSFIDAIEEASIDCFLFAEDPSKCFICAPTDRLLYLPQLHKDMAEEPRCKPLQEETKVAQKIIVEDVETGTTVEFAYIINDVGDIEIFEFSENLNGYIKVNYNHPLYQKIIDKIRPPSPSSH